MSDPRDKCIIEPEAGKVILSLMSSHIELEPFEARQLAAHLFEAAGDAEEIADQEPVN